MLSVDWEDMLGTQKGNILEIENVFYNKMGLPEANMSNWRQRAEELIGDNEVEYRLEHSTGKYPIVRIWSEDKEALDKVLDNAINFEAK